MELAMHTSDIGMIQVQVVPWQVACPVSINIMACSQTFILNNWRDYHASSELGQVLDGNLLESQSPLSLASLSLKGAACGHPHPGSTCKTWLQVSSICFPGVWTPCCLSQRQWSCLVSLGSHILRWWLWISVCVCWVVRFGKHTFLVVIPSEVWNTAIPICQPH